MNNNYSNTRKVKLQEDFDKKISPCNDCELSLICKHHGSLNKFDFNPDVFEVSVNCKIKREYTLKRKE